MPFRKIEIQPTNARVNQITTPLPSLGERVVDKPIEKRDTRILGGLQTGLDVVFGGGKIGEAIGTQIAKKITPKDARQFVAPGPTKREVLGDVVRTAATVSPLKVPAAGTILGKAAQFGGISAAAGAGEALRRGKTNEQVAMDAFISGITGATIGGTIGIVGKGLKAIATQAPKQIFDNALKVSTKVKIAGKSPSGGLIEKGIWGNLGTIYGQAKKGAEETNKIISSKMVNSSEMIKSSEIIRNATNNLSKTFGKAYSSKDLLQAVKNTPIDILKKNKTVPIQDANALRQQLDSILDTFFLREKPAPLSKEATGAVANELRRTVQTLSGTQKEFSDLSLYVRALKSANRAIEGSRLGPGLIDVISGTGGFVTGFATGEEGLGSRLKRGAIGLGVGVGLERGVRSAGLQTGVAQIINKLNKLSTDTAGKISKTAVLKLLNEAGDIFR